jgi:fucose 4-O-acetylase-like acetyltransferase
MATRGAIAMPGRTPAGRMKELEQAKGLAILLVVFGHLVAREDPAGVTWYEPLRMAVYLFHMPFFLYLSGYVAGLSGAAWTPPGAWPRLARARASRLLLPFLAFGLFILVGKLTLGRVVAVDNVPADFWSGLRALVWDTGRSPATSVWYMLVLFVYALALPVLAWCGGRRVLLGVAVLLYVLPAPPLLYLDRICLFFAFFVAGVCAASAGGRWLAAIDRWRYFAWAGFAALLLVAWSGWLPVLGSPYRLWLLAVGLAAMPALHALMRAWPCGWLRWLGGYVFPIYLLNTICIGLTKAALLPVMAWDGAHFLLFAAALMTAGVCGPIIVASGWAGMLRLAGSAPVVGFKLFRRSGH